MILETDLSFSSHVKAVTKSAYYHLKNISRIRCFASSQNLEKLVHALSLTGWIILMVSSPTFQKRPLDSCSSSRTLLQGFWLEPEHLSISHQSSGPYTGFQLHWIDFKVLLLVYKSLNCLRPKYIADMITDYKPNRTLRSVGSSQLEIQRVNTKTRGVRFRSCNRLPEEIRYSKTLATFKSRHKTHLFSCAFVEWALCYVRTDCTMYNHFLLLTVLN